MKAILTAFNGTLSSQILDIPHRHIYYLAMPPCLQNATFISEGEEIKNINVAKARFEMTSNCFRHNGETGRYFELTEIEK